MIIYLRILATIYALAATMHIGSILGFGRIPFEEAPFSWQVTDYFYGVLDSIAAVGLFLLRPWGVAAFLVAAVSEILLFTFAADWLVVTPEQMFMLRGFIVYHLIAIGIYLWLWRSEKRGPLPGQHSSHH
ncbi:MAG: hypothetical protein MI702_08445 [Chlorobiales bacterium]|nr:hypothetical protein [Chlorobiales bacterium]